MQSNQPYSKVNNDQLWNGMATGGAIGSLSVGLAYGHIKGTNEAWKVYREVYDKSLIKYEKADVELKQKLTNQYRQEHDILAQQREEIYKQGKAGLIDMDTARMKLKETEQPFKEASSKLFGGAIKDARSQLGDNPYGLALKDAEKSEKVAYKKSAPKRALIGAGVGLIGGAIIGTSVDSLNK
jgi:hypothetical protein